MDRRLSSTSLGPMMVSDHGIPLHNYVPPPPCTRSTHVGVLLVVCIAAVPTVLAVMAHCSNRPNHPPLPSPTSIWFLRRKTKVAVLGRFSYEVRCVGRVAEGRSLRREKLQVQPGEEGARGSEGGPPVGSWSLPSWTGQVCGPFCFVGMLERLVPKFLYSLSCSLFAGLDCPAALWVYCVVP